MKKIVAVLLAVIVLFAFLLELSGSDDEKKWSFRSYCEYVTENIEPFPTAELTFSFDDSKSEWNAFVEFLKYIGQLLVYPLRFIGVCLNNVFVIFDGFFPVKWGNADLPGGSYIGETGNDGEFGAFGGGGFGGGGGGAR
jgi:hypothetical protein